MTVRDRETETAGRLLRRAAQRARTRPPFMAWLLAQAQTRQGCSEAQRAARARAAAGHRCPAWRPASSPRPGHFIEDVTALAARLGAEPTALATLVRQDTAGEPSNGSPHP
jgi:hypothetical protein